MAKILIGNIKGPKGDTGEKGDQGIQGIPGPQGPTGEVDENTPITFSVATQRANIESGDSLAVAFGKLAKYCTDLKSHAFTDPVNNLTGTNAALPLAAPQGKKLQENIENIDTQLFRTEFFDSGYTPSPKVIDVPKGRCILMLLGDSTIWCAFSNSTSLNATKIAGTSKYQVATNVDDRTITVSLDGTNVRVSYILFRPSNV